MDSWQLEFSKYLFVDVEASGLHAASYPIEVGVCGVDLIHSSKLIRPVPDKWSVSEWSPASEKIHGIGWNVLQADGEETTAVANWLNDVTADKIVLSDNPEFDAKWLGKLFQDTGIEQTFELNDAAQLERQAALKSRLAPEEAQGLLERVKSRFPHPHRAGPDARRAAARFLVLAMPGEIDEILDMA